MNRHSLRLCLFLCAAVCAAPAGAQQRVEFQRQKFDRSRFDRPDPTAPLAPAPAAAPAFAAPAAEPVGYGAPAAPASAPMATEAPAVPAAAPAAPGGGGGFPPGAPQFSYPIGATPEEIAAIDAPLFDQVPSKWFNNAKDYPELLELQKKTGACLLVYFKNPSVPNEKGLCSWFEKSITTDIDWRKAMKFFIKLEITLPGPSAVRDLVAQFRVNRTPAIFVVKPGDKMPFRLMVFEYPEGGGRPTPIEVPVVLTALKSRCTPAYQTLF
ncbi:MAG: hypothetical protein AB7V22_05900 [Kiritimatiellia bacterium]